MRTLLTSLAVLAMIFVIGCGGDDKATDGCSDGCGCGDGGDGGGAATKVDDKAGAEPPAKTDGDAAKTVDYKCAACGKTENASAAPS